ncbi:hypothetical protein BDB00DRAFT_814879 [Zychaea mexicana]|uniref:uncharacterized protein n=1 Tax=Zychaea mexicana TaxID=64656 RepID=UPI0022FE3581|nr:uncharacterized protein BDB00DRAFT_814879 [Zychaea mexicana]KAI9495152.1 hypothetical protein BDB00DRAFT_814879 [Zychaea mexicana]
MPRYHSASATTFDHHYQDSQNSRGTIITTTATSNSTTLAQQHSWHKDAIATASFVSVLPFELLSAIFAMLPMEQSIRCTRVCKAWRSFIFSWEGLWRELSDSTYDFAHVLAPYKSRLYGQHVKVPFVIP